MRSTKLMVRKDGSQQYFPSKCDKVRVAPGDTLYFNTWGGGGWGDPTKRDTAKVAMDARRGLITRNGARRYGVVMSEDFIVDEAETRRLRDRMVAERGPAQMFDRGGTIEELKSRAKRETHIDPPSAPVFQKWMQKGRTAQAAE
jgi:N-methylhydantoinase B